MLRQHLLGDIDKRHIRPHRVTVVVGIPVACRLAHHLGLVAVEGITHVHVDGLTIALQLPVAGHGNFIPSANIVVLAIEVGRTRLRVFRPVEKPLTVERDNLSARSLL